MWQLKLPSRRIRSFVFSVYFNVFVCLSFSPCSGGDTGGVEISEPCKQYLHFVAISSSRFLECAFLKARPFTVCTSCFDKYALAYNEIINLKNGRGQMAKNCSEDLFSGDRVSIVNRAFEYLTNTWGIGRCDDCLVVNKKGEKLSFRVANSTLEFRLRSDHLNDCIKMHLTNKSEICTACVPAFHNLSNYYSQLAKKSGGRVCMDILDKMNQTRVEWAQYGCIPVYGLSLQMYLLAAVTLVLTIMFYLYVRVSQKPKDARIIEGRTMHHHVSKMSLSSDLSRLGSSGQQTQMQQAGASDRMRPLLPIAS